MKRFALLLAILFGISLGCRAQQPEYNDYFTPDRLRLDMVFTGNSKAQNISLESVNFEKSWSGTKRNLIYPFDYGDYMLDVYDGDEVVQSRKIFSFGFNALFSEWRTTDEATKVDKAFGQSFRIPMPKKPVTVVISARQYENGLFKELNSFYIDPADLTINREVSNNWNVVEIEKNGSVEDKVDIVFIAEGYTAELMDKFIGDVKMMTEYLFTLEPYKSHRSDFNIWAVKSESKEDGPDIPQKGIWRNTVLNSSFYTFYMDRYLTAPDQRLVSEIASNAPCDAMVVIDNTDIYGGGGLYNSYCLCASDARFNKEVFVHEFGHGFAALGDEYFESQITYNDMYNLKVEPWEPNITTQVNFNAKWADMIGEDGVGLYEGGGYCTKGIWRPIDNCRMRNNNTAKEFCPVCRRAISRMIDYFCR